MTYIYHPFWSAAVDNFTFLLLAPKPWNHRPTFKQSADAMQKCTLVHASVQSADAMQKFTLVHASVQSAYAM